MAKRQYEEKLAAIEALRHAPDGPELIEAVRKALRERNNYAVSRAAAVAAARGLSSLIPDLLLAYDRFFAGDPVKTDPQCWAKIALARALRDLDHRDPAPFLRGAAHFQYEPSFGPPEDTGVTLRAVCALALVQTNLPDLEVLAHLAERLADPARPVRVEAAKAIGETGRPEGGLALRVKALCGDPEPEVTGECLAAILRLPGPRAAAFVASFLESRDDDLRLEAAAALAAANEPAALERVTAHWEREKSRDVREAILPCLAASTLQEAGEFLLQIVENAGVEMAAEAIRKLGDSRFRESLRARVEELAQRDARLQAALREWRS